VAGLEASLLSLDERLSRVEKRLDELVAAELRYALRTDVQGLTGRVDALSDRLDTLEQRFHPR
jgi:polyhydroxyalkanoate synthesis regulator phasin